MSVPTDLLTQVLELEPEYREELLRRLIISLEPVDESLTPEEWKAAWTEEIERRLQELDEGRSRTYSHEEVMAEMRQSLAEARKARQSTPVRCSSGLKPKGEAMSIPSDLLTQALELEPQDREELLRRLIISLEPVDESLTPEEWEAAWGEEIEQRLHRFEAGETEAIPTEEAIAQIRRSLKERRAP